MKTRQGALEELISSMFNDVELRSFLGQMPATAPCLAGVPGGFAPLSQVVFETTRILERHGSIDTKFFAALAVKRPRARQKIQEVATMWGVTLPSATEGSGPGPGDSSSSSGPGPGSASPPPLPAVTKAPSAMNNTTLKHFAFILDRCHQWLDFTDSLRNHPRHFLAVVHGDERQNIRLFIKRVLHFSNGKVKSRESRSHEIVSVQCHPEGHYPSSPDQWKDLIIDALADKHIDRGELPAMLDTLAHRSPGLIVFIGANNGGLRHEQNGLTPGVISHFVAAVTTLIRALPTTEGNPIRILIPIEHATKKSLFDNHLLQKVEHLATLHPDLDFLPLHELTYPLWADVLETLRVELQRRKYPPNNAEILEIFGPIHEAYKTTHSFAELGQALSQALDEKYHETSE